MIVAALFEIVVWVALVGAAASSREWLALTVMAPIALFRVAVSIAALVSKRRG